jgi:hypothetical protein
LIGAPRLTLAPAVAPSAIPIIPPWAHVLTHDWRSEPSEHRVEWHEDVVVFPFCGAEGANMAVTGVRQGTVVYDFAGWSLPRTGGEEEKPRIRALAAHAARALASGGSVHVSGLDRLATAGIAGVVWLDPLYVSGEGWELCPEGSGSGLATNADGAETDTEADPDPDPTVNLTHFQTHFATIVMGPGWAAEANRHRPHFVPPGDSWDAQLLRNELHKWYHR